ncbi:MAG: bifunctional (p)ppGpp synthetase/guanosine-3',5'-bis(diphosphate) 3'-pyrophosphohydrolase [Gemmatimonadetes bacterium]|nr:bifunctional (p)ppGpp synthetase/guanosine-3',5'-bis(diphosphate) 3'-pyrophosphohydrolase [Gemmatimonadota bacterium]
MSTQPLPDFDAPPPPETVFTFDDLVKALPDPAGYDVDLLRKALDFATIHHEGQTRRSGLPYVQHCLAVARILARLRLDTTTIVAGLLHDVIEDTDVGAEDVKREFGEHVATIVDGVTKIGGFEFKSPEEHQAENWRKMLLAIARDLRVILIKLADRLHNMRTLDWLPPEKRQRIARETREIYAPLAHRFGIATVKWELEDLAFKHLEPEAYREIVARVSQKRDEREAFLGRLTGPLAEELKERGIEADISGRAKHFYSIWNKMNTRHKRFDEIHDLMAIRMVVPRTRDCYETLGTVHSLWKPVPERIKDYIASPKSNHYRSLHTTVIGPDNVWVEFQIRTPDMHQEAEFGIAAHWAYKEGKTNLPDLVGRFPWLGELVKEQADQNSEEFLDLLKSDLFQGEVFVFTPKGELKVLPKGGTPIDFAYQIHTEVGNHCVGARVNGRIVPLRYRLENADTVEIITSPMGKPSQDWLSVVASAGARSKVRRWFRLEQAQHSVALGKEMLEREAKRHRVDLSSKSAAEIAKTLSLPNLERVYAVVGQGDLSALHVIRKLFPDLESPKEPTGIRRILTFTRRREGGVKVQGLSNVMIRYAQCCQPLPGESVIGVITRGRGITVHRSDCPNTLPPIVEVDRRIAVDWDIAHENNYRVNLLVEGENRKGILADVSSAITGLDTNILSASMEQDGHRAVGRFLLEVQDLPHFQKVLKVVKKVKGVDRAVRVEQGPGEED